MLVEIVKANYLDNFKIQLLFSDNKEQIIDFEVLKKKDRNPMTKKYSDLDNFKNFKLDYGDLNWNDYEMCFPVWDLYNGKI